MRYEGVAISDDDETDYSSGEESAGQLPLTIVTQVPQGSPCEAVEPQFLLHCRQRSRNFTQ